ncbi:hypothetical protein, partial [Pseudomonas sp. GW531-R1]|uniref:hypothetical protein n=1 Tax=Pseudomonas sp. GW531-R1 TaxID=2075556 RepID=UPI001304F054
IRSQKILILILLLAVPSFSAFATCAADFAALSDASVKSLRQRYAFFRDIGSQDNIAFRALAERANRGEKTEAKLFLDVENAVMK